MDPVTEDHAVSIRLSTIVAGLWITVASTLPSYGGVIGALARDFAEVNNWPCPYSCWDREAARSPMPGMIENAWRRQNLLADHHFTSDNNLSPAGQRKVRWILTEAPMQHRTIFVRHAESADQTVARINSIRQYADKAFHEAGPANILETYASPPGYTAGWPGTKDETFSRKFQGSLPEKLYVPDRATNTNGGQ